MFCSTNAGCARHPDRSGEQPPASYYKAILQNLFFATLNRTEMHDPGAPPAPGGARTRLPERITASYRSIAIAACFRDPDARWRCSPTFPSSTAACSSAWTVTWTRRISPATRPCGSGPTEGKTRGAARRRLLRPVRQSARRAQPPLLLRRVRGGPERDVRHENRRYKRRGLSTCSTATSSPWRRTPRWKRRWRWIRSCWARSSRTCWRRYNPETGVTARKQTGSFYTPREIVDYMVDESLIAYFSNSG